MGGLQGGYLPLAAWGVALSRRVLYQRYQHMPERIGGQEIASLARTLLGGTILFITGRDLAMPDGAGLMQSKLISAEPILLRVDVRRFSRSMPQDTQFPETRARLYAVPQAHAAESVPGG